MSGEEEEPNPMNGGVFISPLKVNTSFRLKERGRIGNAFNIIGAHTTSGANEEPY